MLCVGHNTLIPLSPLDEAEAQFEKVEKLVEEHKCHHSNLGQPFPNLRWGQQIFLKMSDA